MKPNYSMKLLITDIFSRVVGNEANTIMAAYWKCKCCLAPAMSVVLAAADAGAALDDVVCFRRDARQETSLCLLGVEKSSN